MRRDLDFTLGMLVRLSLSAVLLTSCVTQSSSKKEALFNEIIKPAHLEDQLVLKEPKMIIGQPSENEIILTLENKSPRSIGFPFHCGIRMFIIVKSGEWQEVKKPTNYIGEYTTILAPFGKDIQSAMMCSVTPDLQSLKGQKQIRVVVFGKVYQDGQPTDEQVAAFVDINLK
jgi:hypothetical protein